MILTKITCPHCQNGGCYGGAYAPRPARCGDCGGTGYFYQDEDGNEYEPGTRLATDGVEHFDIEECKDWVDEDGTGPDGEDVWMTELE